ncbi:MAG: hypothetical protein ACOCUU_00360 [Nanoarchaeota archaeon]
MRFIEKQEILERKTYEALNDLEEEFGLEVDSYPEVRWLGKLGNFNDLFLPERYREEVVSCQKKGGSIYLYRPNVIILNKDENYALNEEASHCFHLRNSRITLANKTKQDWFAVNSLIEMFGFLGSKILDPSRKNPYHKYPDYLELSLKKINIQDALEPLRDIDDDILSEFLIHSQGYGLGDRMFYSLVSRDLKLDEIKKLLMKNFKGKGQATKTLLELRERFWPMIL